MTTPIDTELAPACATHTEQAALEHLWIHQASWRDLAERRNLRVFERGEGIYLFDVHGRRFIDAMAGLLVVNIGHGRRVGRGCRRSDASAGLRQRCQLDQRARGDAVGAHRRTHAR